MIKVLWVASAAFIGVLAPRWRLRTALALTWLAGALVLWPVLLWQGVPVIVAAAALAIVPALLTLLGRRFPRLAVLLLQLLSLGIAAGTVGDPILGTKVGIAIGIGALLAVIAGTWETAFGIRLFCAAMGARLLLLALPVSKVWTLLLAILGLLLLGVLARPRKKASWFGRPQDANEGVPSWRGVVAGTITGGLALAAFVVGAAFTAHPMEVPADPIHAARLAELAKVAPHGGLLWPNPSEAMTWDGTPAFPWFENLNARYLSGADVGLVRLPGSSTLLGQISAGMAVVRMRTFKRPEELVKLRHAAQATVEALREAVPLYRAGATEEQIAQAITAGMKARGCEEVSFPLIVAAGAHGATPHWFDHGGTLEAGQLVVTDIGCYRDHYASDFTRTLPVGGRFTPEQRHQNDAVLAAQQAALAACRPGVRMYGDTNSLQAISRAALADAGVDPQYPHGLGHPVGLFVHDVSTGRGAMLDEGMVVTLEPGLYVPDTFGIRIEDTYLVTDGGCELLTSGMPASAGALEAMMAGPTDGGVPLATVPADGGSVLSTTSVQP